MIAAPISEVNANKKITRRPQSGNAENPMPVIAVAACSILKFTTHHPLKKYFLLTGLSG